MTARILLAFSALLLFTARETVRADSQEKTGRIEGHALIPQDVARRSAHVRVTSVALYFNSPSKLAEVPADEQGRFVFEGVPVGTVRVVPVFDIGGPLPVSLPSGLTLPVTVREGETTEVTLFGQGRPITGKLLLPPHIRPESVRVSLSLISPPTRGTLDRDGRPRRDPARDLYGLLTAHRPHEATPGQDGTFRIGGVREGIYRLLVSLRGEAKSQDLPFESVAVPGHAYVEYGKVTLPPIPGGQSDKPLDLGTLRFRMHAASP